MSSHSSCQSVCSLIVWLPYMTYNRQSPSVARIRVVYMNCWSLQNRQSFWFAWPSVISIVDRKISYSIQNFQFVSVVCVRWGLCIGLSKFPVTVPRCNQWTECWNILLVYWLHLCSATEKLLPTEACLYWKILFKYLKFWHMQRSLSPSFLLSLYMREHACFNLYNYNFYNLIIMCDERLCADMGLSCVCLRVLLSCILIISTSVIFASKAYSRR